MTRVLMTQIGKPKTKNGEYELTTYVLGDQQVKTPMISYGLIECLQPDTVVFLGTTGSSWSSLLGMASHEDPACQEQDMELMVQIEALERQDADTPELRQKLQALECRLSAIKQIPVRCCITPYVDSAPLAEAAHYLKVIHDATPQGAQVFMDVTHGLRYHPMLALLSAVYLRSTRSAEIAGIFYGAFDRKKGDLAPILRLDGLVNIIDWISALSSFDKDGDYGCFSALMRNEGVDSDIVNALDQAAFFERVSNAVQARERLTLVRNRQFDPGTPLAHLFEPQLRDRLDWINVQGRGNSEFRLAKEYLQRHDFVRAAIYAQEGYISKNLERNNQPVHDYVCRNEFSSSSQVSESFRQLKKIRNAMAHGLPSNDRKTQALLKNAASLKPALEQLIRQLEQG